MAKHDTNSQASTPASIIRIWQQLTQPPAFIVDEDVRNHIHITKSIIVFSLLCVVLAFLIFWEPISFSLIVLLLILYALTRTQYHRIVPNLLILIAVLIVLISSVMTQAPYTLFYLVVIMMMGLLICSISELLIHTALTLIGMVFVLGTTNILDTQLPITFPQVFVWGLVSVGFSSFLGMIHRGDVQHLQSQRTRYRALTKAIPDMIFSVNRNGLQLEGYIPDWMPFDLQPTANRPLSDILPQEIADEYIRLIRRVLDTNTPAKHDYQLENEMGLRDYEARIVKASDDEAIVVVRDVTDVREHEKQLKNVLETSPDFVYVYEVSTRKHLFFNHSDFLGYTSDDFSNLSITEVVHPDYKQTARKQVDAECADTEGKIYNEEYIHRAKGGDWHWIRRRSIVSARYPDGRAKEIMVTLSDITERKQRESAQRESERKALSLIEHSTDGILLVDQKGLIAEWSPRMTQITGLSKDDVIGQSIVDVQMRMSTLSAEQQREAQQTVRERVQRFLTNGENFWDSDSEERQIKHTNGEIRTIQAVTFPIETEIGYMAGGIIRDVTHLRETEKALKASETRRQLLLEVNPDLIFWLNREGYYTDAYIPVDWHTQTPLDEISGKQLSDFFDDAFAQKIVHLINIALDTGEVQHIDYQIPEVIGLRDYEARFIPASDDEVVSIARDITLQKQAERALKEETLLLQTLIDAIPQAIYVKDREHRFIRANQEIMNIHGQNIIGKSDKEFDHLDPAMVDKFWTDEEQILNEGIEISGEETALDATGKLRWMLTTKVPLRDDTNTVWGLAGISIDITEEKRTKDMLAASEMRLRTLLDSLPIALIIVDRDLKIESAYLAQNPYVYGKNIQDIIDQPIASLLPPDDAVNAVEQIQNVFVDGMLRRFPAQIGQGSNAHWYENRIAPVDQQRVSIVIVDITENKLAEQKAIQADIEKQRTLLLTQFVQNASHEFRTPLSVIQSSAYLLSKSAEPEQHSKRTRIIQRKIQEITTLVDNMVILATLEGNLPFQQSQVRLANLLEQVIASHAAAMEEKQLSCTQDIASDIPMIQADAKQLIKAFSHLIENAIRYSSDGGTIYVRAKHNADFVTIVIRDEGVGMSDAVLIRVFERFYRYDQAHTTPGFGLGLPIAKKIIERHGGAITVESQEGEGSTFFVVLPVDSEQS